MPSSTAWCMLSSSEPTLSTSSLASSEQHCGGTARWLQHKALQTSDVDNQRLGKDRIVKGGSPYGRYANALDRVQHIQQPIA